MPRCFDKAARDEWLALGKQADVLTEPAQANPDLLLPRPTREPQTTPCTNCGAGLAPFVLEHRLNCPHCGAKQEAIRWEGVMSSERTASPIFQEHFTPPATQEYVHPNDRHPQGPSGWGGVQACPNCGHGMVTFEGQRGAVCPNCGNEEAVMTRSADIHAYDPVTDLELDPYGGTPTLESEDLMFHGERCPMCGGPGIPLDQLGRRMHFRCRNCGADFSHVPEQGHMGAKISDASMPPEGPPMQPKETALPYNPGAYEGMVEGMHPAAQFTYERAVQQGAPPQAAMAAAQEKQGEMMKRTQEGQNTEGVQIPVISSAQEDREGFVTAATIQRVSHLLS